jgi:hypothetical protein
MTYSTRFLLTLALALTPSLTQPAAGQDSAGRTALTVGERLTYDVKFGFLKVGSAKLEVADIQSVRGRDAWHTVFTLRGGTAFYKVDDRFESWIDASSFASLRHSQNTREGKRERERLIDIFPERGVYVEHRPGKPDVEGPTVDQPLDDGSFFFFLRTVPLVVGQKYEYNRYYKPDRNPVRIDVVRRERVSTPAGTFETVVLRPVIKSKGVFAEGGRAEVWVTDDDRHLIVRLKANLSFGSLSLALREYEPGTAATLAAR